MAPSRLSPRGRVLLLAALTVLCAALLAITGFNVDLMTVLPALATAAVLVIWPYAGLELVLRISRRRPPRPRRARASRRRRLPTVARGGRLLAASLGGRAPPALVMPA
jgi:hypothetical protein